jgi:hypothetical protein
MKVKRIIQRLITWVRSLPLRYVLLSGALILLGTYALLYLPSKPTPFSYAGATCVKHLLLFPSIYRIDGNSGYSAYTTGNVKLGNFPLGSTGVCFEPQEVPKSGTNTVAIGPLGGVVGKKNFALKVPSAVTINVEVLDKPIPVSRSLTLELSDTDKIFSYNLAVDGKSTECTPEEKKIACKLETLKLDQGKPYSVVLSRLFKSEEVNKIVEKQIMTLSATKVTESSIRAGETVYSKPRAVSFTFDKKITKAEASLMKVEGDNRTPVSSEAKVTDKGIEVVVAEDLPRSVDYEVRISSVEAEDGSGLEQEYVVPFKMSGGPKVTGVNVGKTGVAAGSTVVVAFDQALSGSQDISKVVSLGGGATVSGRKDNQLLITLAKVPKCGDFTIELNNDLQSKYDISGNSAWKFAGRIVCHSIATIGHSQRGRAINVYVFGSGTRTIVFTGAIHGSEVSTKLLMERWIQELETNARSIPGDKRIVVIPQINPDGVSAGTRTNARNVDLNRNFATADWQRDVTDVYNRPFPGGGGQSPASESEVRSLATYIGATRPLLVLSYHSIGGVLAANSAGNSNALAATYSQISGYRNASGATGDTFEYAVSGTAEDWYAGIGVGSILIELGSHTYHQFERNQKAMWAMVSS